MSEQPSPETSSDQTPPPAKTPSTNGENTTKRKPRTAKAAATAKPAAKKATAKPAAGKVSPKKMAAVGAAPKTVPEVSPAPISTTKKPRAVKTAAVTRGKRAKPATPAVVSPVIIATMISVQVGGKTLDFTLGEASQLADELDKLFMRVQKP